MGLVPPISDCPFHVGRIVQFYLELLSHWTVQEWRCMNHVFLFILYSFPCSGKLQTSRLYIMHPITQHIQCGAFKLCLVGLHSWYIYIYRERESYHTHTHTHHTYCCFETTLAIVSGRVSGPHVVRSMIKFRLMVSIMWLLVLPVNTPRQVLDALSFTILYPSDPDFVWGICSLYELIKRNIYPGISYKVFLWLWIHSFQLIRIYFLGINMFLLRMPFKKS